MSDEHQPKKAPEYKVGFCRPPPDSQFKPGHTLSKGRPKASRNTREQMSKAWHSKREVVVDGERQRLSHSEIGALNMATKASKGDHRAYQAQLENEEFIAQKAEARAQAFSKTNRSDELTMASIVQRIRALPANTDDQALPADPSESREDPPDLSSRDTPSDQ